MKALFKITLQAVFSLFVVVTLVMAMVTTGHAQSSRAGTGEVISFHDVVLKPGVDPPAFEKWVTEYLNPTLEGLIPGIRAYITKADRGGKKGQYSYIIVFDSYKTRQAYYPEPGKRTEHYHKAYFEPNIYLFEEMSKYIDMNSFVQSTDWVVLR